MSSILGGTFDTWNFCVVLGAGGPRLVGRQDHVGHHEEGAGVRVQI
jgi:hypothetical protein